MLKKYKFISSNNNFIIKNNYNNLEILNPKLNRKKKMVINFYNSKKNILLKEKKKIFIDNKKIINKIYPKIKKLRVEYQRGFCVILNLVGLGYHVSVWKNFSLRFTIGYNHWIFYILPKDIMIRSKKRKIVFLFSYYYFNLRKTIIDIRNFRKLSIYKLKGIQQKNELYKKKNWKKGIF